MLNLEEGKPIALVYKGKNKGEIIYIDTHDDDDTESSDNGIECETMKGYDKIVLKKDYLSPLLDTEHRQVCYIAGPSGSGKTTYACRLASSYKKIFPKRNIFLFSRTDCRDDPAYKSLKPKQITLDESLVADPIDIEKDIPFGSLIMFDDTNTVSNDKIKNAINKLLMDIMECGRKLGLWVIITNHLVNPSEKKLGRIIMNEMQAFTFFPKSGNVYQVNYCLTKYFGLNRKQIEQIFQLKTRWVTIFRNYPTTVMHQHGAYIL